VGVPQEPEKEESTEASISITRASELLTLIHAATAKPLLFKYREIDPLFNEVLEREEGAAHPEE
jgi:hypothetical protein